MGRVTVRVPVARRRCASVRRGGLPVGVALAYRTTKAGCGAWSAGGRGRALKKD